MTAMTLELDPAGQLAAELDRRQRAPNIRQGVAQSISRTLVFRLSLYVGVSGKRSGHWYLYELHRAFFANRTRCQSNGFFRGWADSNTRLLTGFGSKPLHMHHWKARATEVRRNWCEFCQSTLQATLNPQILALRISMATRGELSLYCETSDLESRCACWLNRLVGIAELYITFCWHRA